MSYLIFKYSAILFNTLHKIANTPVVNHSHTYSQQQNTSTATTDFTQTSNMGDDFGHGLELLTDSEFPEEEDTGKVKPYTRNRLTLGTPDKYLHRDTVMKVKNQLYFAQNHTQCPVCSVSRSGCKETTQRHVWDHCCCCYICNCGYFSGHMDSLRTHQRRAQPPADRRHQRVDARSYSNTRTDLSHTQIPRNHTLQPAPYSNNSRERSQQPRMMERTPSQQPRSTIQLNKVPSPKKRRWRTPPPSLPSGVLN